MVVKLLARLTRWLRQLVINLKLHTSEPEMYELFEIDPPLYPTEVYKRLEKIGFTLNLMGMVYPDQRLQMRRVYNNGERQIHIRFYADNWLTGHDELSVEHDIIAHNQGRTCRALNDTEKSELREALM